MGSPSGKVGDIFLHAGLAFTKLGEMTAQLESNDVIGKWTEDEIDMLKAAVSRFSEAIGDISQRIKLRTLSQTKESMKAKLSSGSSSEAVPIPGVGQISGQSVSASVPVSTGQVVSVGGINVSVMNRASPLIPMTTSNPQPTLAPAPSSVPMPVSVTINAPAPALQPKQMIQRVYVTPASSVLQKNEDMTLSALNSPLTATDMDVEGMSAASKIQNMW